MKRHLILLLLAAAATLLGSCVGPAARRVDASTLPSDHYLRLTGLAGKVIRGEIPVTPEPPGRWDNEAGL